MGNSCSSSKDDEEVTNRGRKKVNLMTGDDNPTRFTGASSSNDKQPKIVIGFVSRPELGLYDTRVWDSHYALFIKGIGKNPGRHPDPNCTWNTNEE